MYTSLRKKEESKEVLIRFKPRKNGNMGEKEKERRAEVCFSNFFNIAYKFEININSLFIILIFKLFILGHPTKH